MCKFGLKSVGAPGLRFPAGRRSLYSSFPFRRKTGGLRAYLVAIVLAEVRGARVDRRNLWALRAPRIPGQVRRRSGGGCRIGRTGRLSK